MNKRRRIYEGKAKILFEGPEPGTIVQYFKDDATAFNAKKKGVISGKGVLNNRISEYVMSRLADMGIPTHFVRRLNMREQLVREVEIIPIEVVVRNIAAGTICKRLGLEEGTALDEIARVAQAVGTAAMAADCTSGVGWAMAPGMRTTPGRHGS
jgi:phosphoribosylaminoimidazole-succinocarboxamide synthase